MPTEILISNANLIVLADSSSHAPTSGVALLGTRTDTAFLTAQAASSYRQTTKFDFTTPRGTAYTVKASIPFSAAPTVQSPINFYIGFSDKADAADNNPGDLVGSAGAYSGYGTTAATACAAVTQLEFIGSLVTTAAADTHVGQVGTIFPKERYGIIVIHNNTNQAFASAGSNFSIHLTEIVDESQ